MNLDDFEQRVSRTPLRPPPAAWREEILAAAQRSEAPDRVTDRPQRLEVGWTWRWIRDRIMAPWPVLAAAWGLVLALNGASAWIAPAAAPDIRPPRFESGAAARAYQTRVLEFVRGVDAVDDGTAAPVRSPSSGFFVPHPWRGGMPGQPLKPPTRDIA